MLLKLVENKDEYRLLLDNVCEVDVTHKVTINNEEGLDEAFGKNVSSNILLREDRIAGIKFKYVEVIFDTEEDTDIMMAFDEECTLYIYSEGKLIDTVECTPLPILYPEMNEAEIKEIVIGE